MSAFRDTTPLQNETLNEIYTLGVGSLAMRADCAACGTRHDRDALALFRPDPASPERLLASICDGCAERGPEAVRRAIFRMRPPVNRLVVLFDGEPTTFRVADPDFAVERRS